MSYANPYTPATDFSAEQKLDHDKLDAEFGNIKASIDGVLSNLQVVMRSDDKLANASVHRDAVDAETLVLFRTGSWRWKGTWATTEAYATGDLVHHTATNKLWVCVVTQPATATWPGAANWRDVSGGAKGDKGDKGDPFAATPVVKTGSYTVLATERNQAHHVDASGGNAVVTLPTVASATPAPWTLLVSKTDASTNTVQVRGNGAETINGAATVTLTEQGDFVAVTPLGTLWRGFSSKGATGLTLPLPISQGGTAANNQAGARAALGLGSAATLNAGAGPNQLVQRDGSGNIPGAGGTVTYPIAIAQGGTGATTAPAARTALSLGSAALLNAGTAAGNLVQLAAASTLPALNGAALTNLPTKGFLRFGGAAMNLGAGEAGVAIAVAQSTGGTPASLRHGGALLANSGNGAGAVFAMGQRNGPVSGTLTFTGPTLSNVAIYHLVFRL